VPFRSYKMNRCKCNWWQRWKGKCSLQSKLFNYEKCE